MVAVLLRGGWRQEIMLLVQRARAVALLSGMSEGRSEWWMEDVVGGRNDRPQDQERELAVLHVPNLGDPDSGDAPLSLQTARLNRVHGPRFVLGEALLPLSTPCCSGISGL